MVVVGLNGSKMTDYKYRNKAYVRIVQSLCTNQSLCTKTKTIDYGSKEQVLFTY